MSATGNYFTEDGRRYIALRISPVSASMARVKRLLDGGINIAYQQKLEQNALRAVREYDRGCLGLETTLSVLLEIAQLTTPDLSRCEQLYRVVLEDKPWKHCCCPICHHLGIEVVIFRGNDRNRRRGFHNTHIFYKRLQRASGNQKRAVDDKYAPTIEVETST